MAKKKSKRKAKYKGNELYFKVRKYFIYGIISVSAFVAVMISVTANMTKVSLHGPNVLLLTYNKDTFHVADSSSKCSNKDEYGDEVETCFKDRGISVIEDGEELEFEYQIYYTAIENKYKRAVINNTNEGTYYIVYTAETSRGKEISLTRVVIVEDDAGPTVRMPNYVSFTNDGVTRNANIGTEHIYEIGGTNPLWERSTYYSVSDNDSKCTTEMLKDTLFVDDSKVDLTKPGQYTIYYNVTDCRGNITYGTREVTVVAKGHVYARDIQLYGSISESEPTYTRSNLQNWVYDSNNKSTLVYEDQNYDYADVTINQTDTSGPKYELVLDFSNYVDFDEGSSDQIRSTYFYIKISDEDNNVWYQTIVIHISVTKNS